MVRDDSSPALANDGRMRDAFGITDFHDIVHDVARIFVERVIRGAVEGRPRRRRTGQSGAVIGRRRRLLAARITEGDSFANMAASEICPVARSSQESGRHGE